MVESQAYLFLVFSLTGVSIGILFDIFRVLRKSFKTIDFITYIEDVLFWILTGIIILYNIWYFNDGEIRIYMFLGIILGVLLYVLILSNLINRMLYLIINSIKKVIIKLLHILKLIFKPIIIIFQKMYSGIETKIIKKFNNFPNKRGNLEKNGE